MQSILPSLTYSHTCSTTVEIRNLGARTASAMVEPHRESGSLVAFIEQTGVDLRLGPGEARRFTLKLPEATENAWVSVRELVTDHPALAVTGETACTAGSQVHSALREVAHPTANPWFEGDVGEMAGARVAVVNTSEAFAVVSGCYSGGTLVSIGAILRPLCTGQFREQIPPFSARHYPVARGGSTHFSLHASGRGIALQMMRLLDAGTNLFQVDSSISFGSQ